MDAEAQLKAEDLLQSQARRQTRDDAQDRHVNVVLALKLGCTALLAGTAIHALQFEGAIFSFLFITLGASEATAMFVHHALAWMLLATIFVGVLLAAALMSTVALYTDTVRDRMARDLRRADPDSLTPLQALALLAELKKRLAP